MAELVYGVAIWRRLLAAKLGGGAPSAAEYVGAFLRMFAGAGDTELRELVGAAPKAWVAVDTATPLGVLCSFPDPLVEHFEEELRADGHAGGVGEPLDAFNVPAPLFVRANALLIERDALALILAEEDGVEATPTPRSPWGLRVAGRLNVLGSRAHRAGLFEVQDEASQAVGVAVGVAPGETVLDLCAGAGGKSLLLAACVGPSGRVIACDPDGERLDRLRVRARRAGAESIIQTRHGGPAGVGEVDRVLVDAPCSELGALRRGPDRRFHFDASALTRWPPIQRALLEDALRFVRRSGTLVYATCTLNRAENEALVDAFLRDHPELVEEARWKTWPHRDGCDGFFCATLRRL